MHTIACSWLDPLAAPLPAIEEAAFINGSAVSVFAKSCTLDSGGDSKNVWRQNTRKAAFGLLRSVFGKNATPLRKTGDWRTANIQGDLPPLQQRLAQRSRSAKRDRIFALSDEMAVWTGANSAA